ncbi:hypothetical protein [Vibrio sp. SCSIO 43136]|uniref:hypothetical protein n=1 Tax=Vibrio sp. SCSIO 43136 TaxID=2819101 RepID=UPI002074F3D3|nr:hypothetical protein [Vibrio sp. SCSIO 43136]USD67435.1 hypothetical protein J4N39_22675 [Vibrio sp. SCSIO 43136]
MRSLKIETFRLNNNQLMNTISIPLVLVKGILALLPKNIASKFDENGEQLAHLVEAVSNADYQGKILEIEDVSDDERVIFSILS